jgi:predicted kinase
MPQCFMMVGVPGSGKSTAIKALLKDMPHLQVVSTDDYIDRVAAKSGKTYTEVYADSIDDATKWLKAQVQKLIKDKTDFVWDQTNVVKTARAKRMTNLASNGFETIAIVFEVPVEELHQRLDKRAQETGKFISRKLLENMLNDYTRPGYDEGFKSIIMNQNGRYVELEKSQLKATV